MEIRITSLTGPDKGVKQRSKKEIYEEVELTNKIVKRAWKVVKANYKSKFDLLLDIDKANQNCPMNLKGLLEADDENFYHDIIGIGNNMNRKTGKLENCFLLRFAK